MATHQNRLRKLLIKIKEGIMAKRLLVIIFFVVIIIVAIVVWTISSVSVTIVAGGSTSVYPILQDLTEQYRRDPSGKSDIIYNAIGSAAALTFVQSNVYAFGFLSEEVSKDKGKDLLSKSHVKTFAFAQDFIILTYHLPKNCVLNPMGKDVYKETLADGTVNLHLQFGSFTEENGAGVQQIRKLYNGESWEKAFDVSDFNSGGSETPVTFTRESGSGTRLFFDDKVIHSKDYNFSQTESSSGAMFGDLNKTPNSIGFMSFDYMNEIGHSAALNVFAVTDDNQNLQLPYLMNTENEYDFNSLYSLTRPFVGIVNTTSKYYKQVLLFIAWMLVPYPEPYEHNVQLSKRNAAFWYRKDGAMPLNSSNFYYAQYNMKPEFGDIYDDVKDLFAQVPGGVINASGAINEK